MIIIYPMLTSSDISPNIIPAICKTLEKFVLLYKLDEVLKIAQKGFGTKIIKVGSKLLQKEAETELVPTTTYAVDPFTIDMRGSGGGSGGGSGDDPPPDKELIQNVAKAADELTKTQTGSGGSKVHIPDHDSLSLDPSYLQIETSGGPRILGIKVIPFPVKGTISMAKLMTDDIKRKSMEYVVTKYSRKVSRLFYSMCRSIKIPFIKSQLTGDPRKDILFASTKYGIHTFPLFNFMDLSSNQIYKDPKIIQKLQKMSWGSYIIADDVKKRVIFCMKEFGGLCSTVLYSYMMASFKKGKYYDVYADLEDIKRASSQFFRMKVKPNRLIGESCAQRKKETYINIKEEIIKENLNSIVKSLAVNNIFKKNLLNIENGLKSKNAEKIKKSLQSVPKIPFTSVEKFCKKISSNFENSYSLCKKVIGNSTSIPEKLVNPISCIIAIFSSYKNENFKQDTQTNLQNVVREIRKIKTPVQKESENVQEALAGGFFIKYIAELFLTVLKTLFSTKMVAEVQWQILTFSFPALWAAIPTTAAIIIVSIITLIILTYLISSIESA